VLGGTYNIIVWFLGVVFHALNYMQTGGNGKFKDSSSDAQTFAQLNILNFSCIWLLHKIFLTTHWLASTFQLQQRKMDIAESLNQVNLLKAQMANLQAFVDEYHNVYYDQALELARKLNLRERIP
jgi:Na+/melibiose symporter-like transporter